VIFYLPHSWIHSLKFPWKETLVFFFHLFIYVSHLYLFGFVLGKVIDTLCSAPQVVPVVATGNTFRLDPPVPLQCPHLLLFDGVKCLTQEVLKATVYLQLIYRGWSATITFFFCKEMKEIFINFF
jgi:hypothetical protein